MTGHIQPRELSVTSHTSIDDLENFVKGAGSGKVLAKRTETEGAVVLYISPRSRLQSWAEGLRLLLRRQPSSEEARAREAVRNIFLNALPAPLQDRAKYLEKTVASSSDGLGQRALRADIQTFRELTSDKPLGADGQFGSIERFAGQSGVHTGGKTGSRQVKANGTTYQLKFDVQQSSKSRNFFERGLNVQNLSEVIASAVMRSAFSAADAQAPRAAVLPTCSTPVRRPCRTDPLPEIRPATCSRRSSRPTRLRCLTRTRQCAGRRALVLPSRWTRQSKGSTRKGSCWPPR